MIYDIRHVTTYDYESRAQFARCRVNLRPRATSFQRVLASRLDVEPRPVEMRPYVDYFGNHAASLRFADPHARLVLRAFSRVAVERKPLPHPQAAPAWEEVAAAAAAIRDLGPSSPAHHLFASRHVPLLPAAADYARASFPAGRPVLAGALDLVQRLHGDFAFDSAATDVSTPIAEVLAGRRGVCQDFAHLMIAGLRGLGLPAAYVSGYLRTFPPPGGQRLVGGDASHAWVALWCGPRLGWIGLDPTNGVAASDDHVVLAMGRCYSDVSPVTGIVLAASGQRLGVEVDVVPAASAHPPAPFSPDVTPGEPPFAADTPGRDDRRAVIFADVRQEPS